ncbi:hypothetical protein M0R45_017041 [Rubus argutus]|uniref:Uncharacterized protein n=1 Tax=Rubus argutus TaxID=59490 RepID=A0AAW1XU67_RUBAR
MPYSHIEQLWEGTKPLGKLKSIDLRNVEEPGKRSRLWSYDDVHHVLTSNTATHAIEVITLDLSNSKEEQSR